MTEPGQPIPQRIGDAERDRAAELLREHMAQGRLTAEEFDERVDAALKAKVSTDLDPLFTDLPGPRPGQEVATTPAYQPPPWQGANAASTPAPAPAALPPRSSAASALNGLTGALWLIIPLALTFIPGGWAHAWWLIFVPMLISMVVGRNESQREHERRRIEREQERLDRRRRALGD